MSENITYKDKELAGQLGVKIAQEILKDNPRITFSELVDKITYHHEFALFEPSEANWDEENGISREEIRDAYLDLILDGAYDAYKSWKEEVCLRQ
jgi:hypothetical protein